jgi:hypothetical protein
MSAFDSSDGIAVAVAGDLLVALWSERATLERMRWLGARLEEFAAGRGEGEVLMLIVILPKSSPPEGAARAESNALVRRLGGRARLVVTVPLGDSLWLLVVRAVMRTTFVLSGNAKRLSIASTEADGIRQILAESSSATPGAQEIEQMLSGLYARLAVARTRSGI